MAKETQSGTPKWNLPVKQQPIGWRTLNKAMYWNKIKKTLIIEQYNSIN